MKKILSLLTIAIISVSSSFSVVSCSNWGIKTNNNGNDLNGYKIYYDIKNYDDSKTPFSLTLSESTDNTVKLSDSLVINEIKNSIVVNNIKLDESFEKYIKGISGIDLTFNKKIQLNFLIDFGIRKNNIKINIKKYVIWDNKSSN